MTDKTSIYLARAVLALVVLLGVLAAAHLVSQWLHESVANWLGAIGTVGTLIGTMVLATSESRRRSKHEYDLACLIAFRSYTPVILMHTHVSQAMQILHFTMKTDLKRTYFEMAADCLAGDIPLSQEDLAGLVPLPEHVSRRLAEAIGSREAAKQMLAAVIRDPRIDSDASHQYRWESAAQISGILGVSAQRSESAMLALKQLIKSENMMMNSV